MINTRAKAVLSHLLSRCRIEGTCWVWRGSIRGEYGTIRIGRVVRNVHRVAYAAMVDDIPEGVSVTHTCGNKLCCNPSHLQTTVQPKTISAHATRSLASNPEG